MKFLVSMVLALLAIPLGAAAEDPQTMVQRADQIRAPQGAYDFEAVVTSYEGDQKKSETGYKVSVKDLDHVLVEFRSPPSEKGKSLLMLGDDLWIYLPDIKKPVRIPVQQRLVGEISNGDMARSKFADDYTATLASEEALNGQPAYVLDLVAKSENKTYHKIKYWIAKSNFKPVKAEFFTVSGQSLKICAFEDFRMAAGAVRPMRLVFQDTVRPDKKSIMAFTSMTAKKLEDRMFTKEYMQSLE